jgi:peptide/nickel transport system permease protein
MARYITYRLLLLVPVLAGISVVVFLLIHLIPGDVVDVLLGIQTSPEAAIALRRIFGLDQPLHVQFASWASSLLRGDLGLSLRTGLPVSYLLKSRLVVTAELTGLALFLAALIGIPLGVIAAFRQNTATDYAASSAALVGLSMPDFWTGTLMVLLLSIKAGWLPPTGYVPFSDDPVANLKLMFMPTITLAGGSASYIMRMTRSAVLEVLSKDYIRTAHAKGLRQHQVVGIHAFRNALVPIMAIVGQQMAYLLGGVVVVESIFAVPGIGRTALESIYYRDYPVVMGVVLFVAFAYVVINVLVDVLSALVDVRIRERIVSSKR